MLSVDNNFHSRMVLFSQVSQTSPAQKGICTKISEFFSRAIAWISDFILRSCCCQKPQLPSAPRTLALPIDPLPVPEPQPLPVDLDPVPLPQTLPVNPAPVLTGYHIIDNPNPEPYVFAPRPFPLENRYPLIRVCFEGELAGQIGHYYRLANAPVEQLERLEGLYQREIAEGAAIRQEIEALEQQIVRGNINGEAWTAALGLYHDMRGFNQRPLHIIPVDEAALGQIDINDLLVCFEGIEQRVTPPERWRQYEAYRNLVSVRIRRLIDFVNEPGNEEFQRTIQIFIQTLRRPHTYHESFAGRAFFHVFSTSNDFQEYLQKMPVLIKFLCNINGPVLRDRGANESLFFHLVTLYSEKQKEDICLRFANHPQYNGLSDREARQRILEDHYSPADQIQYIREMFGYEARGPEMPLLVTMLFRTSFNPYLLVRELCNRLMGDNAERFYDDEHLRFIDVRSNTLTAKGIAFLLEHTGFLTRQNIP